MIEIKTTGETPLEALASLVAFGQRCMSNETVRAAADRILIEEQKKVETAAPANSQTLGNLTPAVCQTIGDPPPAVPVNPSPLLHRHRQPGPAPTPVAALLTPLRLLCRLRLRPASPWSRSGRRGRI